MKVAAKITAALNAVSHRCGDDDLGSVTIFLCVCEHNGICIKDLARRSGLNVTKVSRSVECLRQAGEPGLVDVTRHPTDGRRRLVFLTEDGVRLRDEMENLFKQAAQS